MAVRLRMLRGRACASDSFSKSNRSKSQNASRQPETLRALRVSITAIGCNFVCLQCALRVVMSASLISSCGSLTKAAFRVQSALLSGVWLFE